MPRDLVELRDEAAVAEAAGGDLLACWAAQVLGRGGRAWTARGAVAVEGPDLQRRHRLVVTGDPEPALALVRTLRGEVVPGVRLTAAPEVVTGAGVRDGHGLVWRDTRRGPRYREAHEPRWLSGRRTRR